MKFSTYGMCVMQKTSPHMENLCHFFCKISFITIYALCRKICFVAIYALLSGEKFIQNDKCEVWNWVSLDKSRTSSFYIMILPLGFFKACIMQGVLSCATAGRRQRRDFVASREHQHTRFCRKISFVAIYALLSVQFSAPAYALLSCENASMNLES